MPNLRFVGQSKRALNKKTSDRLQTVESMNRKDSLTQEGGQVSEQGAYVSEQGGIGMLTTQNDRLLMTQQTNPNTNIDGNYFMS